MIGKRSRADALGFLASVPGDSCGKFVFVLNCDDPGARMLIHYARIGLDAAVQIWRSGDYEGADAACCAALDMAVEATAAEVGAVSLPPDASGWWAVSAPDGGVYRVNRSGMLAAALSDSLRHWYLSLASICRPIPPGVN